ncbi:MAG: efflux RND transporter periplasmic adaptor subunit [bacterium]
MNRSSMAMVVATFLTGIVLGAVGLSFLPGKKNAPDGADTAAEAPAKTASAKHITLTGEKLKVANLKVSKLKPTSVRETLEVPATIGINVDKRVQVHPRVLGVVREVDVVLGQKVKAGQRLALLESPDVGSARLAIRACRFALQIARREAEWRDEIAGNVALIMVDLGKKPQTKEIEKKYSNVPLGHDRAMLLASYAKLELALHEEDKQQDLYGRKLVGEHVYHAAMHAREASQAEFESAMEQTKFDVGQEKRIADQKVQQAEVSLIEAVQKLKLLGVRDEDTINTLDLNSAAQLPSDWTKNIIMEDVAAYPILAAFDGTITSRSVVVSQKVDVPDQLFTLADLNTVRITAQIAEKDFATLGDMKNGDELDIIAPGSESKLIHGKIIYVGAEVDPQTRTVPVIAETSNASGQLRPGQFCRVRLQRAEKTGVIAIPGSAIVEWNSKPGVFIAQDDGKTFEFQPILIDQMPTDDEHPVIVRGGLKADQNVVTGGAFMLKSELILENEPEEE